MASNPAATAATVATIATAAKAAAAPPPRKRINPLLLIASGAVLMMGAGLMYWLEPRSDGGPPVVTSASVASSGVREAHLRKAREREDQARAEQERIAAEEAAERARRAAVMADAATEAQARNQREEMARKQAAVDNARRSVEDAEEAWKRFYKPSANCSDPAARATVECVNEYVKAKREFESRR